MPDRVHADWCDAEVTHDGGCGAATQLAQLVAFAQTVRDEFTCTEPDADSKRRYSEDHLSDCWSCQAEHALERHE
jgi:hypothetical protein